MDAVEAIREALDAVVPAIIISGDTSPERLKQVKKTGLLFLHKPVRADELHQHMQTLLKPSTRLSKRSPTDESTRSEKLAELV